MTGSSSKVSVVLLTLEIHLWLLRVGEGPKIPSS
jgi:hypothetical protein